jgi:hypothetical protein
MSVSLAIIQPQVSIVIDGEDPQVLTAIDADTLNGVTAGTTGLLLLATATAGAARTVLGVDSDDAVTFGALTAPSLRASTSGGLLLLSSNGTTVATLGAGGGTGVTFAGGVNMQALGCTTVTASGSVTASGTIFANGGSSDSEAVPAIRVGHRQLISFANSGGAPTSFIYPMSDNSLGFGTTNSTRMILTSTGSLILGPDPGGSELFRSGGSIRFNGNIVTDSSATHGMQLGPTVAPAWIRYNTSGDLEIIPRSGYGAVIGIDPGGSELFRAGGSGRFSGNLLCGAGSYFSAQASGSAAPSLASRSAGTKVILYETFSAGVSADAAIGIESGFLWFGGGTSAGHKWYTNTTNTMLLSSAGALTTSGKLSANSAASSSTLTGSTVAQVISWLQTVFM